MVMDNVSLTNFFLKNESQGEHREGSLSGVGKRAPFLFIYFLLIFLLHLLIFFFKAKVFFLPPKHTHKQI